MSINLAHDESNVPLHFDVRYNWSTYRDVAVLAYCTSGSWTQVEELGDYPFQSCDPVTVMIVPSSAKKSYEIYVNGKYLYGLKYSSNGTPDKVKYLAVIMEDIPAPGVYVKQIQVSAKLI